MRPGWFSRVAALDESHGVKQRCKILPAPDLIYVKTSDHVFLPDERPIYIPEFVHSEPSIRRVVVDLLLSRPAQCLNLGHIGGARKGVHALLHSGIGIDRIVPEKRTVADKRHPIIGRSESGWRPITRAEHGEGRDLVRIGELGVVGCVGGLLRTHSSRGDLDVYPEAGRDLPGRSEQSQDRTRRKQ